MRKSFLFWSTLFCTLLGFPLTSWAKSRFERLLIIRPFLFFLSLLGFPVCIFLLVLIGNLISQKMKRKPFRKSSVLSRKEIKERILNASPEEFEIDKESFPEAELYYANQMTGKKHKYYLSHRQDFLIGRASYCQAHIQDSKISRDHALIRAEKRGYKLYDLASHRGIFVNGKKVREHLLQDGEVISLDTHLFEFRLGKEEQKKSTGHTYRKI